MWRVWIDTGGTFTDGLAVSPDGVWKRAKILSTGALRGTVVRVRSPRALEIDESWAATSAVVCGLRLRLLDGSETESTVERFAADRRLLQLTSDLAGAREDAPFELISDEPAPVFLARLLTGIPPPRPLQCRMRLATTLGTNALLERRGVPTALFVTHGFEDLLTIGTQQRPDLFALEVRRRRPLHETVVGVRERIAADGEILEPLDEERVAREARQLVARGIRTAAVALVNAYRDPGHEQRVERTLIECGFEHVSCSAELAPRIKLLPRAETAVVNSYLAPLLHDYLARVEDSIPQPGNLLVMTSAGGLLDTAHFRPKDGLLSGPAGGVIGSARVASFSGAKRVITFDMGGTSTDVARWEGDYDYVYEHGVGDAHLAAPALAIETVAAGGGSVCWLDGERLRVGPHSAGARPGPACYGAGGPLALTDVNLLLGRLDPARFGIPIREQAARTHMEELRRAMTDAPADEELLEGFLAIANETMADAMRRVSLRRGYDPADHTLVAFGGAGGQHACAVADLLGVRRVLIPRDAALLSALGLGHAVIERFEEAQVLEPLDEVAPRIAALFEPLAERARAAVVRAGASPAGVVVRRRILHLRFAGQDATLDVDWEPNADARRAFADRHARLFGHRGDERPIELESVRVVASSEPIAEDERLEACEDHAAHPARRRRVHFRGRWIESPVFDRERLGLGARLAGPALILDPLSATVVEPGWRARVDAAGALVLDREAAEAAERDGARPEAVRLELFTQRFTALVREMGERLERTAISTNVKERLDFSCALLDRQGRLVANAPHIPVHLGALGLCVREVSRALPLEPGDVAVTNHPGYGGSHLPDVTVITPVHLPAQPGGRLIGYVASRAHHAEIGGARAGSMPPAATRLVEEGVVIPPTHLVRGGKPLWDEIRKQLEDAPYPTRSVADNLADLRASVAANHAGAAALLSLAVTHGEQTVQRYMVALGELSNRRIGDALERLDDGVYEALERLDDGTPLRVRVTLAGRHARFDFNGSGDVHPGNLNATPAIVRSAVIYVLRLMLDEPLPLNEGLLRAVTLDVPSGILAPHFPEDPRAAPAVVGGNVETSQRLVDTLIRALGLAACSQGTMNNVIFGTSAFGYYETLGGGCGAGATFDGASAVHSHMTNTRITDVEILEQRYPIRVERFAIRTGSGGAGLRRGGDGLVRELRFLEPAALSILSQHRVEVPYGLNGGAAGAPGRQYVLRATGERVELGPVDGCEVAEGDRLVVETPGGGGYGRPHDPDSSAGDFSRDVAR